MSISSSSNNDDVSAVNDSNAQNDLDVSQEQTEQVEQNQPSFDYSMVLEELRMIRAENATIKGQLNALQEQRSITIDAGAVIQDDSEPVGTDELAPYSQLDFTI